MSGTLALGFQVGRDVSIVCVATDGTRLDLTGQIEFSHKPRYKTATHEPLNTPTQERYLPNGHEFTITMDRRGPANEALFSQIEKQWWAGGSANGGAGNGGSIFVYTTEADGSQSRYQGSAVSLKMGNRGDAKQENPIRQTIEGFASLWQPV